MLEKSIAIRASLVSTPRAVQAHSDFIKASGLQAGRLSYIRFQKLANPINTSRGTTNLDDEWIYEYCTKEKHSNTPLKRLEHRRHDHSRNSANANIYHHLRQN